ncbi:MAG: SDR family oxidoreductase [Anaerolineae bacterium]|nr:SDR family oxidoreductase [Anaerolineae bacterium]
MMAKRRMLVTGGSGYLGGWVVRLARDEWDVTAIYLSHAVDEPGADWRQLDVRDEAAVVSLVGEVRPQVVVHTAALNPGQGSDFDAVNVAGARHVASAVETFARLIHLSTDVLFDGQKGDYVEEDPPSPITPYGRSKALAEEAVLASGAEAVIVRTSLIYGWRPTVARAVQWIIDDLQAGKPVRLFTDEKRCPIWVESLAAAVVELADLNYTGVLHVAGAQALSRYEFGVRLLRFHGVDPSHVVPTPSSTDEPHPLNCTLDCSRARALLRTPLPGVDEVLAAHSSSP